MIPNIKHIAILGAGESGVGAAILAVKQGYKVFVSDLNKIKEQYKKELLEHNIKFEEGRHDIIKIISSDLVIKSPGIPDKVKIIRALHNQGTPVISEIEFASWFTDAKVVAITGSNGKTTVTLLTYDILKTDGFDVGVAGNLGYSLARMVAKKDHDYLVVEMSSFQLDDILHFKPYIAIISNISPDHLDRYEYSMKQYIASKMRITMNQDENDFLIYNSEDPILIEEIKNGNIKAQIIPFTTTGKVEEGAFLNEKEEIQITLKNYGTMTITELALQGRHNKQNSMAAAIAGKLLQVRKESTRLSLANFESLEHRLEPVLDIAGIRFINDSKATNINSTYYALETMIKPTVWIVGGVDKGNDYTQLTEFVKEKVKGIVVLGKDNAKIHAEFDNVVDMIIDVDTMQDAVNSAFHMSKKGDAVLLSPACASFDLFSSFEDRGRQFKQAIRKL